MAPRLKNALLVLLLVSLGSGVLGCEPEHRWGHERRDWYGAYGPGWYGAPYADGGYHTDGIITITITMMMTKTGFTPRVHV
jgi:hypothetical protein